LQFDRAVTWFGRHVENKLLERTDTGDPLYDLDELLGSGSQDDVKAAVQQLSAAFGVITNG
jgi:hypothetical protein